MRYLLLFAAYFAAARLGLALDAVSGFATLVWPPTGIALSAMLLMGFRYWPAVTAAAFAVNFSVGAPWGVALGIAGGNTCEALIGAFLLKEASGFHTDLSRVRDCLALILWGAVLSTGVSATVGVTSLWLGGVIPFSRYAATWQAWLIGDMLGNLVVTPLLLTSLSTRRIQLGSPRRMAEGLCLALLLAALHGFLFCVLTPEQSRLFPVYYLVFIPLVWTALRFGPRGCAWAVFSTAVLAVYGTTLGQGPFVMDGLSKSLLFLQGFMAVVAVTTLILASAMAELRKIRGQLEVKVLERTNQLRRANEALRQSYQKLAYAEKMETVGQLAAGVAHEVKNPLSILMMGLSYLKQTALGQDPENKSIFDDMDYAIERADEVVRGLMDFSTPKALNMQVQPLEPVLERSLKLTRPTLEAHHIRVIQEFDSPLGALRLDAGKMEQVFVNLFMNSVDAMPEGGYLMIRASGEDAAVIVEVQDTGCGIAPEKLEKVWDPFFTTKPRGKGTGLGLAVTRRILESHGAEISLMNCSPRGLKVTMIFKREFEERPFTGTMAA